MPKLNISVPFEFDKDKDLNSSFYTQALFQLLPHHQPDRRNIGVMAKET